MGFFNGEGSGGFVQTDRARAVDLRTYLRPLDEQGTTFETRSQMLKRSMYDHHERLWADAGGDPDREELKELLALGEAGLSAVAGRTQWLGGTTYANSRSCCMFNCSAADVSTVFDFVDAAWLLLNGCGFGFRPRAGTLHGYRRPIHRLEVVPSTLGKDEKGREENVETLPSEENGRTWTISVGDSARAWAKACGKMFAPRSLDADRLVLDFSQIRGPGGRLKGYGWICNGYAPLATAMSAFHDILNGSAGNLLGEIQIMDCVNWLGTILSSRRAAEICILDSHNPAIDEFERAKYRYWEGNPQRRQSNNTTMFWSKPSRRRIEELLHRMDECGGDPGICNAEAMANKCPWACVVNPCFELLLANRGVCNLVTNALPRFRRNFSLMERAFYLIARANYRQTCVDMDDGILSSGWDQTNAALRLCGVSVTGVVQADWLTDYQIRRLRNSATAGAYSMADELGTPRPKGITCGKPEGTWTKTVGGTDIGDITEGTTRPLGRNILNWINYSTHDPIVPRLEAAGYRIMPNPSDPANVLVCHPVRYDGVRFDKVDGVEVNLESAVSQLNRYLRWNNLYADFNMSSTISYSSEEIPQIADWIDANWDRGYIATAFLRRADPTKTPEDLGHPYLPQHVVDDATYYGYKETLRQTDWSGLSGIFEIDVQNCEGGACPVK